MTMTDVRPADPAGGGEWGPAAAPSKPPTKVAHAAGASRSGTLTEPLISGEMIATAALTLFSIAVAAGYARVFAGWQFFDNFVVLAVVGHGLGFLMRRARMPGWLAIPALAAVMAWMIGFVHYRESYTLLVPTGETIDLFRVEIELVQEQFRVAVAPVIYGGGWDVLGAIGIALMVVLSDTFAFRAFARAEALVPGGVLFVFIAALGSDRDRVALTALLVATGVVATASLRAHHAPHRPTAIGRQRSPSRLVLPAALGTAVVIALAAGYVGPRLPGAESEPFYETRGGNGGSVTEVVSPLVDIRSRLTNRSNSELFVVDATFESYWRSSALPRFDGTTWGLPERALTRAGSDLSIARTGANELRQTISIVNLGGKFVPTAADPTHVSPEGALLWNADSSTLLKSDGDLVSGDVYEVVSASPRFEVAALEAATSTDPGDPIYFELPDGFPTVVGEMARAVTAGAATPYETALTLQNWFRDPDEFSYSLEVQAGHNNNAIEGFLRERIGYCEQFAGTFAAMMRTLGIPSRVAVGFTPGSLDATGGYSVLGKNAHAWPEVWFDGLGWVPFEPTPGRGAPGAENYTNVPPQQDGSGVDPNAPTAEPEPAPAPDPATPTTVAAPAVTTPGENEVPAGVDQTAAPTPVSEPPPPGGQFPWVPLLAIVFGLLIVAGPTLIRRWRHRSSPTTTAGTVAMLWRRSLDAVGEVGVHPKASLTPMEHAVITASQFPVAARPIKSLAAALTEVSYGRDGGSNFDDKDTHGGSRLNECRQWCRQIERAVNDSISPFARVRRYFTHLS